MLSIRQKSLLKDIVEKYIDEAEPVSSKLLSDSFRVSSATIRNEMSSLEESGLIYQPHTSAGRIPTEAGYRYYFDNFIDRRTVPAAPLQESIRKIVATDQPTEVKIKQLAKAIAEMVQNAVLVGFNPNHVYYTGLSYLFNQPEFEQLDMVRSLTGVIDHLDEVMSTVYPSLKAPAVNIGSHNPFGQDCSSLLFDFPYENGYGLIGILGPMRMNYQESFSLLNFSRELISK